MSNFTPHKFKDEQLQKIHDKKIRFAIEILQAYADEKGIEPMDISDLNPFEEWLISYLDSMKFINNQLCKMVKPLTSNSQSI